MATRSKARIAAATAAGDSASAVKHVKVETTASEGKGTATPKSKAAKQTAAKRSKVKTEAIPKVENCTCTRGDDGTPMVVCGECHIWFHFTCVNLAEADAEELAYFVCPSCTQSTGLRSIRTWEGKSAFEEVKPLPPTPGATKTPKAAKAIKPTPTKKAVVVDDSEEEESSEDEYVARDRNARAKRRRAAVASDTDSGSSGSETRPSRKRRFKKGSNSPAPTRPLDRKRKASHSEGPVPHKRGKANADGSHDDPTRKYCLGKLEELFHGIFFRYPRVKAPDSEELVSKSVDEMTDEEKEALTQESKQYADDLEKAIFETYADKGNGTSSAGANYKDRFRTLQFNLSKPDRVVVHQRITSREISPKDLSLMSSTDLANEETKQLIKIAEKEALAHSIIPKVVAPRAKMTHKGFEDIEFDGERVVAASSSEVDFDAERRREVEAEERRERERNARLRGAQRQRTDSMSIPPESPTMAHNQGNVPWGAPPPVPLHALGQDAKSSTVDSAAETQVAELPLGDLINIDEEPSSSTETLSDAVPTTPTDMQMQNDPFAQAIVMAEPLQTLEASPFTPTIPEKSTFDLGALWSAPSQEEHREEGAPNDDGEAPMMMSPAPLSPPTLKEDEGPKDTLEGGMANGDPEPDFDMFFEEQSARPAPPVAPVTVEAMPTVWSGKLSMPLDSTIPQETPMVARQIAGNPLDAHSLLWQTLFPSDHLRVDGRVQVKKSTEYLTSMRLDARRELYAVAFAPATEHDEASFKALSDFLVQKDRHGLVFPWGQRPKEHHPGKELYIIPLKPNEPVPEYLELLDHKLPKQRQRSYLVGIWVLNKGKLAPPTPPPSAPPVVVSPPVAPTPAFTLPLSGTPPSTAPFPNPSGAPLPATSIPPMVPPASAVAALLPPASSLPPGVDPNGLAAEVAALTPEQIQALLRTLQGASPLPPVTQPAQPPNGAIGIPPAFPPFPPQGPPPPASYGYPPHPPPSSLPPASARTWIPGPGAAASPLRHTPPQYPPYSEPARYDGPPAHYPPGDRSDPRHYRGGNNRDHYAGRGRGRGKGQQFDNRESPRGPVDSGWPRKQSYPPPHNQGGYDQGGHW